MLLVALKSLGSWGQWPLVAELVTQFGDRSEHQCRNKYMADLRPGVVGGPLTHDEMHVLFLALVECGPAWRTNTHRFLPHRSEAKVKNSIMPVMSGKAKHGSLPALFLEELQTACAARGQDWQTALRKDHSLRVAACNAALARHSAAGKTVPQVGRLAGGS